MEDLITTAQAADLLGCSVGHLNRMASDGRLIAAWKLPGETGARLYQKADVEALRATQQAASDPETAA